VITYSWNKWNRLILVKIIRELIEKGEVEMRPFKSLISFNEAYSIALDNTKPIDRTEEIKVEDANNRVLAQEIVAKIDVPPYDRAAMDGYAVIAQNTFGADQFSPKLLAIIGEVFAGSVPEKSISTGECMQIATGAMLPNGADSVVMIEDTELEEDSARIFKPVYPKANVSEKGSDILKGTIMLQKGEVINPSKVGVLSSLGLSEVLVYAKPKVVIIPTGDEIDEIGTELKKGHVYNSNSYTLFCLAQENGAEPHRMDIVGDTPKAIEDAIKKAIAYDFVVLSGGSSVGERDVLVDVIKKLGKVLFHGVQVKPGKPLLLGEIDEKLVLGTPGYPTACLIDGYVFMAPIIRKLAHLPEKEKKKIRAKLSRRVVSTLGRQQFLTVRLENGQVVPVFKESGAITSMAEAHGYIELATNLDLVEKGEEVEMVLF
jgi:molybdenum cofactor synthesis domain-containing protein